LQIKSIKNTELGLETGTVKFSIVLEQRF